MNGFIPGIQQTPADCRLRVMFFHRIADFASDQHHWSVTRSTKRLNLLH